MEKILTREKSTIEGYIRYTLMKERIVRRSLMDFDADLNDHQTPITPMQFALWFESEVKAKKMSYATFRYAKAAFTYTFGQIQGASDNEEILKAIALIGSASYIKGKITPKGPARKLKRFSVDDEKKLIDYLLIHGRRNGLFAGFWLKFTRILGMRPSELDSLDLIILDNGDYAAKIKNAKATNGRSHGEFRHIPISSTQEKLIQELKAFIDLKNTILSEMTMDSLHNMIKCTLYYHSKKCFPKRTTFPSLYTMRHQFSANMKASGLNKKEVAALSGHINQTTSGRHYAKKRSGTVQPGVYALPSEVARVTKGKDFVFEVDANKPNN